MQVPTHSSRYVPLPNFLKVLLLEGQRGRRKALEERLLLAYQVTPGYHSRVHRYFSPQPFLCSHPRHTLSQLLMDFLYNFDFLFKSRDYALLI